MFIRPRFVGKRVPPETNWRSLAAGHAALRPRIGPVIEQEAVAVRHPHLPEAGGVRRRSGARRPATAAPPRAQRRRADLRPATSLPYRRPARRKAMRQLWSRRRSGYARPLAWRNSGLALADQGCLAVLCCPKRAIVRAF